MAKRKSNEGWRKGDANPWRGLKDRADKATQRTKDALAHPLNIFQKRKDID